MSATPRPAHGPATTSTRQRLGSSRDVFEDNTFEADSWAKAKDVRGQGLGQRFFPRGVIEVEDSTQAPHRGPLPRLPDGSGPRGPPTSLHPGPGRGQGQGRCPDPDPRLRLPDGDGARQLAVPRQLRRQLRALLRRQRPVPAHGARPALLRRRIRADRRQATDHRVT